LEKETRARDKMNKSVAQAAPPREVTGPAAITADSATGMRLGALMDLAHTKAAASRAGRIEGRITDQSKAKGIAGANVMVQGTTLSVATDNEGKFKIDNVPAGEQRLIVRRPGYAAQTVPLSVKDSAVTANVMLTPSPTSLSELVVTSATTATDPLRQIRSDSTAGIRRTLYRYAGVEISLIESPEQQVSARRDERAAGAAAAPPAAVPSATAQARPPINTIVWTDRGRRYTLSGPLPTSELEAVKAKLMEIRR
jgi:hypothetical protein